MPITATVVPGTATLPPRVQVALSSSDGSAITAATLTRNVSGGSAATRLQPTTGPSPRIVTDVETDWDTPATFTATITSGAGTETVTSSAVTVTSPWAWLIHPTTPALSFLLDQQTNAAAGVIAFSAVQRAATTVVHDIIGSKYRIVTKSGPRAASRLTMQVATVTPVEESRLWAIVDDQTPLLARVPAGYGWAFENGYYSIDDVTSDRFNPGWGPEPRRNFTLTMERVTAPAGTQTATRTYADVLAAFGSYSAVRGAYSSYTNLLTDTRG